MHDFQFEVAERTEQNPDAVDQAPTHTDNASFPTPRAALSKRELQIVRMIGMGKTVGNIAVELNLSVKTVSTYRVRALHKLGMLTNADLMRYVIGHHLDESPNGQNGQSGDHNDSNSPSEDDADLESMSAHVDDRSEVSEPVNDYVKVS